MHRTIRPRDKRVTPSTTANTEDDRRQPPRKKARTACESCKKRKAKCSGQPSPCHACDSLGLDCVFDITKDGRMTFVRNQHKVQVEVLQETISHLVHGFIHHPEHVQSLLSLMPDNMSPSEMATCLQTLIPDYQTPSPHSSTSTSISSPISYPTSLSHYHQERSCNNSVQTTASVDISVSTTSDRQESYTNFEISPPEQSKQVNLELSAFANRLISIGGYRPNIFCDGTGISRLYNLYYQGAKQMLLDGIDWQEVLGPGDDVSIDLLFEKQTLPDRLFDCSSWACELCRNLQGINIFVQMALVFLLTKSMRWLLQPNSETYSKIPEMMIPTLSQMVVKHATSIEIIPIPALRDAMIRQEQGWLKHSALSKLNTGWPHSIDDAIDLDTITKRRSLNDKFINHITQLNNWTTQPELFQDFPELRGHIKT